MGKLPPDAKKDFDGIIFDVYHYNQKMYNGTTETFEILKRADTAIVIPTANNQAENHLSVHPVVGKIKMKIHLLLPNENCLKKLVLKVMTGNSGTALSHTQRLIGPFAFLLLAIASR
mgnify:CR=1 FL=1